MEKLLLLFVLISNCIFANTNHISSGLYYATVTCSNPTEGGSIDNTQESCGSFDPTIISSTAPANNYTGNLEYRWQKSTVSNSTNFNEIAGTNSENYDPGNITQTTWYRRQARVDCKTGWGTAATSNVIEMTVYPVPAISAVKSDYNGYGVSCNGATDGSITLTVTGGTTPYSFDWGNGFTDQDIDNLAKDTYTVTVTDANSCTKEKSVAITQPSLIQRSTVTSDYNGYGVSCRNGSDGTITLTVSGGVTPYSFDWGSGVTTQDINNLEHGTYTVTITDANLCTKEKSATITQPSLIQKDAVTSDFNGYGVHCNGDTDGYIDLSVSGGVSPYAFDWGNGVTSQNLSNLGQGTYTVTITDANNCTKNETAVITEPVILDASTTLSDFNGYGVRCHGGQQGWIDLNVTGGVTAYTFDWGSGISTQNLDDLGAGDYTVTITDVNNCTIVKSATITEPDIIQRSIAASDFNGYGVHCNGDNDGTATLSVSGGVTPYSFYWTGGLTTQDLSDLGQGNYSVTITDANNCKKYKTAEITEPEVLNVSATVSNYNGYGTHCHAGLHGWIELTVTGGATAYSFDWGGGVTTQDLDDVPKGTYTVTVTDANNCTDIESATITAPELIQRTIVTSDYNGFGVSCNGGSDGSITYSVTGGVSPYSYDWGSGVTTQNRSNLGQGTYSVTVTDLNSCNKTNEATITEPDAIQINASVSDYYGYGVSCKGGNDGSITVTASGGVNPLSVSLSGQTYYFTQGTSTIDDLSSGNYILTVTDANLCTVTTSAEITEPAAGIDMSGIVSNVTSYGGSNGAVNISVTGGLTAYSFNWTGSLLTEDISGLTAGIYSVTVTDLNQCTITGTYTVPSPPGVTTGTFSSSSGFSASGNSEVTDEAYSPVTVKGVVWSLTTDPELGLNELGHSSNGAGSGIFSSNIPGLTPGTTYYIKAYATNAAGTTHDGQTSFMSQGTAWNCSYWTNGLPNSSKDVFVNCNYTIGDYAFNGGISWITRSLLINTGVTLSIKGTLNVTGNLVNNGTLVLKSGQQNLPSGQLLDNGNISGTGIYKAERNLYQGNAEHFVSAPMPNVSSSIFAGNSLLKYLNPTATNPIPAGNWQNFSGTMAVMKGYTVKFMAGNKLLTFQGTPNTSAFKTGTVSCSTSSGTNLVGNPYPSAIDWKASSGWTKLFIGPVIQFKKGTVYATYNALTNVSTNGGTRYIPSMQGFLVSSTGNGTLAANNNVRLSSFQTFWKDNEIIPEILRLKAEGGNEEGYETVVMFREDATPGFDFEYDALKLFEEEEGITHLFTADEDNTPVAVNVMKDASVIPTGFVCSHDGRYSIKATEINLSRYSSVWLEDTHTGAFTDLSLQPYYFDYSGENNVYRFRLHFKSGGSWQSAIGSQVCIYSYGSDIYISSQQPVSGTVTVFDMLGRAVKIEKDVSLDYRKIQIDGSSGAFIVRVITDSDSFTKEVMIGK